MMGEKKRSLKRLHTRYKNKDGKPIPGNTTIVDQLGWNKGALMGWIRKEMMEGNDPNVIRDMSARVGTLVHYYIECFAKKKDLDEDYLREFTVDELKCASIGSKLLQEWVDESKFLVVESEHICVSEQFQYGTTIDLIGTMGFDMDKKVLINVKTGSGLYDEHKVQLAAEKQAYEEQESVGIDECGLLSINVDMETINYYPIPRKIINVGWKVFANSRENWTLQKEIKGEVRK